MSATSAEWKLKRKAVTIRKVVRIGMQQLNARLAVIIGLTASAARIGEILEEYFDREIPVLVRYCLRQAGIELMPEDELTPAGINAAIARQTGVPFRDIFDVEKVKLDLEQEASRRFEEATGLIVESFSRENLINAARDAARQIVSERAPAALSIARFGSTARNVARDAYREKGLVQLTRPWKEHAYRWAHREAVRRYGLAHQEIWEWGDLGAVNNAKRWFRRVKERKVRAMWKKNNKKWRRIIAGKDPEGGIGWFSQPATQAEGRTIRGSNSLYTLIELNRERALRQRGR